MRIQGKGLKVSLGMSTIHPELCMSNNGGKAVENAPSARKVGSEVRLRLEEKAPPPNLGSAGQPSPPCSDCRGRPPVPRR